MILNRLINKFELPPLRSPAKQAFIVAQDAAFAKFVLLWRKLLLRQEKLKLK